MLQSQASEMTEMSDAASQASTPLTTPNDDATFLSTDASTALCIPVPLGAGRTRVTGWRGGWLGTWLRNKRKGRRKRWDPNHCRLVNQDGTSNVRHIGIHHRCRQLLADLMTTLVALPFYIHIIMFVTTFFGSWFLFGLIWFTIPVGFGDIHHDIRSDRKMCIQQVNDFATALLFSIETQSTIGYGSRVIDPECPVTLVVLMIQLMIGMFLECFAVGLIYSKLSRSPGRLQAVRFTSKAVICQRNGQYVLAFRVWNIRRSQILGPSIRAVMVRHYFQGNDCAQGTTPSGSAAGRSVSESNTASPGCVPSLVADDRHFSRGSCPLTISDYRTKLRLETEAGDRNKFFLFAWPSTVIHRIDAESPLWKLSASDIVQQRFEVIVTLEGTVESTGSMARFMTSYLSSTEILWGYRLAPLVPAKRVHVKKCAACASACGTCCACWIRCCLRKCCSSRERKGGLRLDCARFDEAERLVFASRSSAMVWAQTS